MSHLTKTTWPAMMFDDAIQPLVQASVSGVTKADLGKRVRAPDGSVGRLCDVTGGVATIKPEGSAELYPWTAEQCRVEPDDIGRIADSYFAGWSQPGLEMSSGTFSNELTPHDNMRRLTDRVTEQFAKDSEGYSRYLVGLAEEVHRMLTRQPFGIYVPAVDTGPPPEKVDHTARRYMTFHRMVSEVMAQEAPKAKFVTDTGTCVGTFDQYKNRVFLAWVELAHGVTATYEVAADRSYDGDGERWTFTEWLNEGLGESGKRSNS